MPGTLGLALLTLLSAGGPSQASSSPANDHSTEFASRPGVCPPEGQGAPLPVCTLDTDCPGLQRCCPSLGRPRCVSPMPPDPEGTPRSSWYNVTVQVKTDFGELQRADPGLLDHTRLLRSMLTSALSPRDVAVRPLLVASGYASTTVSWLLLGLATPEPVASLSTVLQGLVKRVCEVISVRVQDVDECAFPELHACPAGHLCINQEGAYQCARPTRPPELSHRPGGVSAGRPLMPPGTGTPASSAAPSTPQGTPAAGTLEVPPRRGDGGDGSDPPRNGTGLGPEDSAPGTGLAPEPWTATPPPSLAPSSPGLLGSPLHPLGWAPAGVTTELASWPTPTWDPAAPTWDLLQLPDSSWEPAASLDLPEAPTSQALGTPACAPGPVGNLTISDVSSSGFRLAWAPHPGLHPNFQLTLRPAGGLPLRLETRNTSVTLSGLEPGTLYLVDIQARACGKEGSGAQVRLVTAAQKLQGRVRIANARYHESFSNASSPERQAFLQLLLSEVQSSLPAALRGPVDTGGVELRVTDVAPGSVVVDFLLLLSEALDAQDVSASVLAAFLHMPRLQVAAGGCSIGDYDECEHGEHDCEPGDACRNTPGSFSCVCGASPSPREYSGRACRGDPPAPAPPLSGPALPPPPAGGEEAQGRLSLAEAVSVLCEAERVALAVRRSFLRQEAVPEASLYLGQPACSVRQRNASHVLLIAGWGECGTAVQSNLTDTVVQTTLRSDLAPDGVIHHARILSPILCSFRNDLLSSSGYSPQWGVSAIREDLQGAGSFVTEMRVFVGDAPVPRNHSVSASASVRIEVALRQPWSGLKVVLLRCWATPGGDASDPVAFGFINNSCPVPNTHTSLLENGDSDRARFQLRVFSFVGSPAVYLHCRLRVCLEPPASCRVNCNNFRGSRSGDLPATQQTSWGPLLRSEGETPPAPGPSLGAAPLVLTAVAALPVVAGVAALLFWRHQRATRTYSFKTQPAGVGYQVFHG